MAFRMTMHTSPKQHRTINGVLVEGNVCEYICNEESDLAKLPRVGIPGTQEDGDAIDNDPCWYGSTVLLCTGVITAAYALTPDNNWTKM